MEFIYDSKQTAWIRKPNLENKFAIQAFGHTIPVPNYYETFAKYCETDQDLIGQTFKYVVCMPFVQFKNDIYEGYAVCDILTGEWLWINGKTYAVNARLALFQQTIFNCIFAKLEQRLNRLEQIFDHIRSKSSVIDEMMKIVESAPDSVFT